MTILYICCDSVAMNLKICGHSYVGFEVFTAVVMKSGTCLLAGLLNYSSTLKMEAIRSSETSDATQRTTRRHIPEDDTLHVDIRLD
jgi:hypothetical protein